MRPLNLPFIVSLLVLAGHCLLARASSLDSIGIEPKAKPTKDSSKVISSPVVTPVASTTSASVIKQAGSGATVAESTLTAKKVDQLETEAKKKKANQLASGKSLLVKAKPAAGSGGDGKQGVSSLVRRALSNDASGSSAAPKDLATAEGHHKKKYMLVKKKPKPKKIKMDVYEPKYKYKTIKMKIPVKKLKKKKVKGYLVKKHHHH